MAFGLSFAAEGEHDQAISAFSLAARTMRGAHLPLLYLGKEYHLTGVVSTSTRFMKSAFDLCPRDPYVLQEIGYMVASVGAHAKAERYFRQAITRLQVMDSHLSLPAWEPLYNNLGHALRKQGKHREALEAHENALQLDPVNPSTLTGMAFVCLLREDFARAVSYASRSLAINREDQFTLEVLHTAMQEKSEQPFPPLAGPLHLTPLDMEGEGAGRLDATVMVLRPQQQDGVAMTTNRENVIGETCHFERQKL